MAVARRAAVICLIVVTALSSRAGAQIPDKFTNLEVLPKDIAKPELVSIMRGFSSALGVRCVHCHVGTNPADLSTVDFAADDKDAKKIAREMMKMTKGINETLASRVGSMRPDLTPVRCVTCHHGVNRPRTLEQVLVSTLETSGPDSTVAKYRRLRDEYYGSAAYDFGEWSLISVAENLTRDDPSRADAALALLRTNLEYFPESAGTYARMAETLLVKGDTETAMTYFDRALALAPEDPWLKRRVESVKAKK